MADSDKKNEEASADFADDLDAMLNDAESSIDDNGDSIDDEDAIDRLLMDDAFDEFAEDEVEVVSDKEKIESIDDEFDVDDLISSVTATETEPEKNELAEIDEFAEDEADSIMDEFSAGNEGSENTVEQEDDEFDVDDLINSVANVAEDDEEEVVAVEDVADDDFLMADFDISSDDEDAATEIAVEEEVEQAVEASADEVDELLSVSQDQGNVADTRPQNEQKETVSEDVMAQAKQFEKKSAVAFDEINAQISQLWGDNEELKQKITDLSDTAEKDQAVAEEIDSLQKEQRKLRKQVKENETKVPVVTYVAVGIAILALLVGGGLGVVGFGASSDVALLTELVTTLEEEIEILNTKDVSKNVVEIDEKIALLIEVDEKNILQLAQLSQSLQDTGSWKAIVDDLVVQNDHAQKAIELLLAKVETLEQGKRIAAKRKVKKSVPKVNWVVNLVSFKQEWYAKRKALEYEKKGIPAEVVKAKVNGENWFRLRVKGFKSKYEAAAYAVKVKKTLNLTSVWVTKSGG